MKTKSRAAPATWLAVLVLGGLLGGGALVSTAASAQISSYGNFGYGGSGSRNTANETVVNGTVRSVDLRRGLLTISSGTAKDVTVHARPQDIAYLSPGEVVTVQYSNYNNVLWLSPDSPLGSYGGFGNVGGGLGFGSSEDWAQYGTVTGPVTDVDRRTGRIVIEGRAFLAHPEQTKGVFPGQFVSLSFAQVGDQPWVDSIQSGAMGGFIGGTTGQGMYPSSPRYVEPGPANEPRIDDKRDAPKANEEKTKPPATPEPKPKE